MSLKAISVLAIEDPYVRGTLKESEDVLRRLRKLLGSSRSEIKQWASGALDAIEKDDVNKLWSSFFLGPINPHDIQILSNEIAVDDNPVLAKLAESLWYVLDAK